MKKRQIGAYFGTAVLLALMVFATAPGFWFSCWETFTQPGLGENTQKLLICTAAVLLVLAAAWPVWMLFFRSGIWIPLSVRGASLFAVICYSTVEFGQYLLEKELATVPLVLYGGSLVLCAALIVLLERAAHGANIVSRGLRLLKRGKTGVRAVRGTRDELQSLAESFNSLSDGMTELTTEVNSRSDSYLRFVPRQIMTLLGAQRVEEMDKKSFSARTMAVMMVRFSFPQEVYESHSRALFDNVNAVIEKTAGLVSDGGGTIFNFAYNGYDAVFVEEPEQMVRTAIAVRQAVLALNRERTEQHLSNVTFRVALDRDEVMMGVVGDEKRLVPTAISASFQRMQSMLALCDQLDANMLCTEAVSAAAGSCRQRYVGKRAEQDGTVRIYEIYDGDAPEVRQVKEQSAQRFADGLCCFYAGEYDQAKRVFMQLARQTDCDGVVRRYLYLADRYEKEPPEQAALTADSKQHS